MHHTLLRLAFLALLLIPSTTLYGDDASVWTFIQNDEVKLGVKKSSGGAIGWFSLAASDRNLVNHYDHGRLIQQSFYGGPDGSKWAKKDWVWNPVQGGDYKGTAATILKFDLEGQKLYVKTKPKHWATGADIDDVVFEQWIELNHSVAHIRYRMTYSGKTTHPKHGQEIPAVFVDRSLGTLVIGQDKGLKRYHPNFPNEYYPTPRHWAAYIDNDEFGLGVCVPQADKLTCYRVAQPGQKGACSYFAPLTHFAMKPGLVFEYDCYLTIGKIEEIQSRFEKIKETSEFPTSLIP